MDDMPNIALEPRSATGVRRTAGRSVKNNAALRTATRILPVVFRGLLNSSRINRKTFHLVKGVFHRPGKPGARDVVGPINFIRDHPNRRRPKWFEKDT